MKRKTVLVITYHVKNCLRIGGFHRLISYLEQFGYNIDWVSSPVSISWLLKKNDRENRKNFVDLSKGVTYKENGVTIRHFAQPIWIPARVAKALRLNLGEHYWPAWNKLKRRLKKDYSLVLIEGVGCQYIDSIKADYPKSKIIYRPSDILETFTSYRDAIKIELHMINSSDCTLCVDENQRDYYRKRLRNDDNLKILRNPISLRSDIEFLEKYIPSKYEKKMVVYIGVSFVDLECIEYAASENRNSNFVIIGPFNKKSHDNIIYTGSLTKEECVEYLSKASVGINPLKKTNNHSTEIKYGYTRKIINYMTFLLPVVTMRGSNYLNLPGFYDARTKEEFSKYVLTALNISLKERLEYRERYLEAIKMFSEDNCKSAFKEIIDGKEKS